jgi:hypothetical protein
MRVLPALSALCLLPLLLFAQPDTIRWEMLGGDTCINLSANQEIVVGLGINQPLCYFVEHHISLLVDGWPTVCPGLQCPSETELTVTDRYDPAQGTLFYRVTAISGGCVRLTEEYALSSRPCVLFDPAQGVPQSHCIPIHPNGTVYLFGPFPNPADVPQFRIVPGCSDPGHCFEDCTIPQGVTVWTGRVYGSYYEVMWRDWMDENPVYGCFCVTLERILPITLEHITAVPGEGFIRLNWATRAENNVDHFEIIRNGQTTARLAAANTATGHDYEWVDRDIQPQIHYSYQLMVADINGSMDTVAQVEAEGLPARPLPDQLILYGAYPNPFNPATTIEFDLPMAGPVSLTVYDLQGREVAGLVRGTLTAGHHRQQFHGGTLPSGVYLYRLQAGPEVRAGKLMLLK